MFQHTAARRRLRYRELAQLRKIKVSTHSRPKAAATEIGESYTVDGVSTHSRPKAAAELAAKFNNPDISFNTQPPEGGCGFFIASKTGWSMFQHTAARRRLLDGWTLTTTSKWFQHTAARRRLLFPSLINVYLSGVSTHSRPKAAAWLGEWLGSEVGVSTHSRPKAAASLYAFSVRIKFGFNTQPPEGGCGENQVFQRNAVQFQHTAARRRLQAQALLFATTSRFQHTAARRRLPAIFLASLVLRAVSTHSRPKAAARGFFTTSDRKTVSTHSRPKAAAYCISTFVVVTHSFNTQPPEGGCAGF